MRVLDKSAIPLQLSDLGLAGPLEGDLSYLWHTSDMNVDWYRIDAVVIDSAGRMDPDGLFGPESDLTLKLIDTVPPIIQGISVSSSDVEAGFVPVGERMVPGPPVGTATYILVELVAGAPRLDVGALLPRGTGRIHEDLQGHLGLR